MSKAIVISQLGGPEALRYDDAEPGVPGLGQIQVRTRAIGVNYIDVYFRSGVYPQRLPFVPGNEASGVVEEVGAEVTGFSIGDRVAWATVPGSYSRIVNVPAERAVKVPSGVSDEIAAAVMLQGMTAQYLTYATRETRPGDVAVVLAAAGGVGLLLIQMLVRAGAGVIAVCSAGEKHKLALGAGAHHVLTYDDPPFDQEVRRITNGKGADVVYDSVGKNTFQQSLRALRARGLLALYGQSSGVVPPFDPGLLNQRGSLFLTRPSLAHYTFERRELEERAGAVLSMIAAGQLDVHIGGRFPLSQAAAAHRALESRRTTGKLLLIPD